MQLFRNLLAVLVPVFAEFTRANRTIYVEEGDSVTLFCNITPFSRPVWFGRRVNEDSFRIYSEGVEINLRLPNAYKLKIVRNISQGKYDLQISNVSLNEEGLYICVDSTKRTLPIEHNVELKIIVPPRNITIHDENTGVLRGTENHSLVLSCSVNSGEPKETIMWFNDSLLLGIGGPGTYELNIFPQKYDHGRIYTCVVNISALESSLKKNVRLDITYKPNITFNKGKHIMRVNETQNLTVSCKVDSNPVATTIFLEKNSKIYYLSTRKSTLNLVLFNISRNDTGTYVCRAANIIGESYGSTEIIVQYKPVFVAQNDHIQYGRTGTEINITVFVYSCPKFNNWNVKSRGIFSVEHNYIDIEHLNVTDRTYSKDFRMNGFKITFKGFIIEANDFTSYTFWIANSLGSANFTVELIDAEKPSGRLLDNYWQISSGFIGGLFLGIACTIFWSYYRKQRRKVDLQQVQQEVHYDEVELIDQNPVSPEQRTNHPVDTDNVIDPESGHGHDDNTSESNSSEAMLSRSLSVVSEQHDYENSYQPLDLDNPEKHPYDEIQMCSINILPTENTYVNTVL